MEFLIIALIVIYCPWLVPTLFVIGWFVWIYTICEPFFWTILVCIVGFFIYAVFFSKK